MADFPWFPGRPCSRSAEIAQEELYLTKLGNLSSESSSWQGADLGRGKSQSGWHERKMSHGARHKPLVMEETWNRKKKKKRGVLEEN
jgi:hypothetical protein